MSNILPVDATITIPRRDLGRRSRHLQVHGQPDGASGRSLLLQAKELAAGSPLAERLFGLAGVAHVLVAENTVTVGKDADASWSALKPEIGTVIRAQLVTGRRPSSRPLTRRERGGGQTPRFVRWFRTSWTGK